MDSIGRMPYTHKSAQLIYVCGLLYTSAAYCTRVCGLLYTSARHIAHECTAHKGRTNRHGKL